MAIFFSCLCGQPLREDETRAGSKQCCPACGRTVRSPTLERANQSLGLSGELTAEVVADAVTNLDPLPPVISVPPVPLSHLRLVEAISVAPEDLPPLTVLPAGQGPTSGYPLAIDPDSKSAGAAWDAVRRGEARRIYSQARRDVAQRRRPVAWELEKRWYQCLFFPLLAWPLVFGLAIAWTLLITFLVVLPLLTARSELPTEMPYAPGFFAAVGVFVLLGYTCACLQAIYASGVEGQTGFLAWPGRDLFWTLRACGQTIVCFLAGPILPAAALVYFWLNSGELHLVDWLILCELGIVTFGYWALGLLAVQQSQRFRDANPVAVIKFVLDTGYRALLVALLFGVVCFAHLTLLFGVVDVMHRSALGFFILGGLWVVTLYLQVFLLRWLGIHRFHLKKARAANQAADADDDSIPVVSARSHGP